MSVDDLISRKAAIDALNQKKIYRPLDSDRYVISDCLNTIVNLPSAQPEGFEWCTDCKEYDQERHCCHRWTKVIRNTVAELKAEQRWIPCSERLPEDDRTKVVTLANGNVEAGYYSNGDWWCIGDKISLENPTVIAWMPLPEAPEVEE